MKKLVLKLCLMIALVSAAHATSVNITIDQIAGTLISENMNIVIDDSDSAYIECNWADWTGIEDGKTRYSKKISLKIEELSGQIIKFKTTTPIKLKKQSVASLNDCSLQFNFKAVVTSDPKKEIKRAFFSIPLQNKMKLNSNMVQDLFDKYQLMGVEHNDLYYTTLRKR